MQSSTYLILQIFLLVIATGLSPAIVFGRTVVDPGIQENTSRYNSTIQGPSGWWEELPREKKMIYSTGGAALVIGLWGLSTWDYGSTGFHQTNEGWFGENAKYGGADKLGHFWSTYALSDALSALYKGWGYDGTRANNYGALSAWMVQAAMELGDGSSETQGFSWEDMAGNTLGALTSIVMEQYPDLARKIDFRVGYEFNVAVDGIFDDYSNLYYDMVLCLDGFDAMSDSLFSYLEVHVGYHTRGYDSCEVSRNRAVYCGITINFAKIFSDRGWKKTGKVQEYYQLPYTVPRVVYDLD